MYLPASRRFAGEKEKILFGVDFFVRTSLPPIEGIFFDGQIFDAYHFVADLIRKAKHLIVLIDNYVDDSVLAILDKRQSGVSATIYTQKVSQQLQLDINKHNAQYPPIKVELFNKAHKTMTSPSWGIVCLMETRPRVRKFN